MALAIRASHSSHRSKPVRIVTSFTPPPAAMSQLNLPTDQEIHEFYRSWFEANYCTPPAAKASVAVIHAIRAALEHFGPQLHQPE